MPFVHLPDGKRVRVTLHRGRLGALLRFVSTCSGCYESEDGHPVGDYPQHPKHRCAIGAGCHECGYQGVRRRAWWASLRMMGVSLAERKRVRAIVRERTKEAT